MQFPHEELGSLLYLSKPSASLLSSLSPPFEFNSKDRHSLLQMHQAPQTPSSVADAPPPYVLRIPQTISSVCALSPLCSRKLPWRARRRTIGCGRRAPVSAIRGIGGAWNGEPVVACHRQACSGSTSCNRRVVSRSPRLPATAPSTVSAHPGDHLFPFCTAGSTPRPSEDAALFQC